MSFEQQRAASPIPSETGFEASVSAEPYGNRRHVPTGTTRRAEKTQANIAKRAVGATVRGAGGLFASYKTGGAKIEYAENKIGVMPDLPKVLEMIAAAAGVSLGDGEEASKFLDALVTDVYVNPYSDKQTFDGKIVVNGFSMDRVHIKNAIEPLVGTNYRRFARAMAPLVVEVMHDNYEVYGEILDKRAAELNLSTRAEAVKSFDGADALALDRSSAQRNAEAKALAIGYKARQVDYRVGNSAKADGLLKDRPKTEYE